MTCSGSASTNTVPTYRLTADRRRAVCVHEAGHAVMYALGGIDVDRVAVAPEGVSEWTVTGSAGPRNDLWGICVTRGGEGRWFIRRDDDRGECVPDRRGFRRCFRLQRDLPRSIKRSVKEGVYRRVRADLCGVLGGPAAEQLHHGDDPELDTEGIWGELGDEQTAGALACLLPWRGELDRLHGLTVETLRRPDVWGYVQRLADELERVGDVEDDLSRFLPPPAPNWPPSPRARRAPS